MMIFDCFTFYNELDLLDIRLAELYDHVDRFVIVESNQTFTNRPKPYIFLENKDRYSQYLDKITHLAVGDMPGGPDPWVNEIHQRNKILEAVQDIEPDDTVIISDCDEILRADAVDAIRASEQTLFALRMPLYNFKFNYQRTTPGEYIPWAMAARRGVFDEITPDSLRNMRWSFDGAPHGFVNNGCQIIEHAGWHFGYLGDREYLVDKAKSFSHQEVNTPEFIAQIDPDASIAKKTSWLQTSDERYETVELDDYFPKYLIDNKDKYQKFILDNPVNTAYNLLPPYPYL